MPSTPKEETQVGIYHIINRGNMHMQVFDWVNYVNTPQTQKELDKIRNSVNRQAPLILLIKSPPLPISIEVRLLLCEL
jgi:hypothetical protein